MNQRARSPLEGQWRCPTCGRTFGRHFAQCAYCPFGSPTGTTAAAPQPKRTAIGTAARPSRGVTGRVWDLLDGLGEKATIDALLPLSTAEGINESTTRTQFSRWRKAMRVSTA